MDAVQSSCTVTLWMLPVEDLLTEVSCMELTGQYIVTPKMLPRPVNSPLPCGCCPCSLASQLPCGCCLISLHSYPVDVAQYRFTLTLWILLSLGSLLPCGCCPISLHSYPVDVAQYRFTLTLWILPSLVEDRLTEVIAIIGRFSEAGLLE